MTEFDVIRRLAARYPRVGDDAAVLDGGLLVAADAVVEGFDFVAEADAADVGWHAIAVNASDIAAMGGRPTFALVTVVGPPEIDIDGLYVGIDEACAEYGCEVVGGDLSNGVALVVAVTMLGALDGRLAVLRSGARPGDGLWVSGPLGGAAAAGYRTRPRPPAPLGPVVASLGASAMIDLSDGLVADLGHVLDASAVGAILTHVPVADGATEQQALTGGGDYALLFTLPDAVDAPAGCIRIGEIVADVDQRGGSGGIVGRGGWEHDFS